MNKSLDEYEKLIPSLKILESASRINETHEMVFFTKKRKILINVFTVSCLLAGSIVPITNYIDYFINVRPLINTMIKHADSLEEFITENKDDVFNLSANRVDNKTIGQDYLDQSEKIIENCSDSLLVKNSQGKKFNVNNYCDEYVVSNSSMMKGAEYSNCQIDTKKSTFISDRNAFAEQCNQKIDALLTQAQTKAVELKDYKKNKTVAEQAEINLTAMYDSFLKELTTKKQAGEISGSDLFELEQKYGESGYVRKSDKNTLNRMIINANAITFEKQVKDFLLNKKNTLDRILKKDKETEPAATPFMQNLLNNTLVPVPPPQKQDQAKNQFNLDEAQATAKVKMNDFSQLKLRYNDSITALNKLLNDKSIEIAKRKTAASWIVQPKINDLSRLRCLDEASCYSAHSDLDSAIKSLQQSLMTLQKAKEFLIK